MTRPSQRPLSLLLYPLILVLAVTATRSAVTRLSDVADGDDRDTQPFSSNDGTTGDKQPRPSRRQHDRNLTLSTKERVDALLPDPSTPTTTETVAIAMIQSGIVSPSVPEREVSETVPDYLTPFRQATYLSSLSPPASAVV